jgi:putative ABC transport system permease protein
MVPLNTFTIDEHFLHTLNIPWKDTLGKRISPGDCVINEAAIEQLKIQNMPLGHTLTLGDDHTGLVNSKITGVVEDFNYTSLHANIQPLVMLVDSDKAGILKHGGQIYVRLDPNVNLKSQLASIEKKYKSYQSETPFQYYFLDEAFNQLYQREIRLANIFAFFTGLAIFIACLGLFGLATFSMERRTKEIGIRKVLGATVVGLTGLLAKDFLKWVLLAFVIAAPLAWYFMQQWLINFAYRIEMAWWMFFVAGLGVLGLAFLTVCFQSIKAALANPVKSLKSE